MQRQIDFSKRRSIVTTTVAVVAFAFVVSIAVVSSVWVVCSICARLVLFWYAGERYAIGSKSSDLHLDVDGLFNLRQSIEPDCRSLVQQSFSPFALCRFSTKSIQSICQTSLVVASLGFGLGVDPIRASRFPSRFCLASAFVSFECRWYRDVIWSSVHPRSHSVILICVPVLPNVCKMCP